MQVKTAIAKETKSSVQVMYNISLAQLETPITPEVTFVFAVRLGTEWNSFIVIDRPVLYQERHLNKIGTERGDRLILRLRFHDSRVFCGDVDLRNMRIIGRGFRGSCMNSEASDDSVDFGSRSYLPSARQRSSSASRSVGSTNSKDSSSSRLERT